MDTEFTKKLSVIISKEKVLEQVINELLAESISRGDISVQGEPEEIKDKYGVSFIKPQHVQHSKNPPTQEPYLDDDFSLLVAFSFAIPLFIGIVVGIFVIGDVRSNADNILYGLIGALIGGSVGLGIALPIHNKRKKNIKKQEKKGGFVVWVTPHTVEQYNHTLRILQKHQLVITDADGVKNI